MICVCFFCCTALLCLSVECDLVIRLSKLVLAWTRPMGGALLWCSRGSLLCCELEVPVWVQGAYLLFACFPGLHKLLLCRSIFNEGSEYPCCKVLLCLFGLVHSRVVSTWLMLRFSDVVPDVGFSSKSSKDELGVE